MKSLLRIVALLILATAANAQVFDITTFGAVGNGSTVNTQAIQAAIDSCHNTGGGIVEVPAGTFVTGTVFLKSNVNFHISSDATIKASSNMSNYPDIHPQIRTYTDNYPQKSVFYAEGQSNISVTGEGTFNGDGQALSYLLDMDNRPFGFRFVSCTNVRYEGITMRNSPFWMMHNFDIDTLVIKNLTIVNQAYGNNDGVNIDACRNVLVDSVTADCNDDPLVIKTTSLLTCRDVEIRNCTVATYSRAIKIGTEIHGPVENVHIHNVKVQFSTQGPFGSNTPATCGINLSAVDGGSLKNILVENIDMTGVETPLLLRLGNRARKYTDTAATPGVGFVNGVAFRNINATATTNVTSTITGIPNHDVTGVELTDVNITFPGGWSDVSNGFTVPENESEKPDNTLFGDTIPGAGLYIRHVDSIRLERVCFYPLQPDSRKTVYLDDVTNFDSSEVCITTDIRNEPLSSESIQAFPNPFSGTITVRITRPANARLVITDVLGEEVYVLKKLSEQNAIDLRNLADGIYFIRIMNGDRQQVMRIMKRY